MNFWATIYRCLWGIAVVLIVIVMISFFIPKYRTLRDYRKRRDEIQKENVRTEALIRDLRRKQEQILSDPEFIARTARELGMIKPDEKVIKFTNNVPRRVVAARPVK